MWHVPKCIVTDPVLGPELYKSAPPRKNGPRYLSFSICLLTSFFKDNSATRTIFLYSWDFFYRGNPYFYNTICPHSSP